MFMLEAKDRIWIGTRAELAPDDRDLAWAERSYRAHPALAHVVGKFIEADKANSNRQQFSLEDVREHKDTIPGTALNWAHTASRVVGHIVDAELLYPAASTAGEGEPANPFVEILGSFYKVYFPEHYKQVRAAHEEGSLALSMECVAKKVKCAGAGGCGAEYAYMGPRSDTYTCGHINEGPGHKLLMEPTFLGGALLVPPAVPGWKLAKVSEVAGLVESHVEALEAAVSAEFSHLNPLEWESLMTMVISLAGPR